MFCKVGKVDIKGMGKGCVCVCACVYEGVLYRVERLV